ncbi:hypothetical protein FH581_017405 (plasmid) [Leptospira weilii]|uniref:hypothetical protein n=1 Tax=Leptospira weilii TaxID=28184 RepID=UPI00037D3815|nr:hypothetical protein [Leptospira weilii]MDL5247341.1 hypothetical protein [Leptospira weilii]ULH30823.1 hypothetical protein FH586_21330 [Leptospira weilii]UPY80924.1 hypothetical protein FH581_017405 [Leptospira weilii]
MKEKEYYISVGEPWDFASPDGQNRINGKVLKKISSTCLVFKTNYFLEYEGSKSNILILSPRHYDSDFDDLNKEADLVTINGGLLLNKYSDNLTENELKHTAKFFVIGSIRLVEANPRRD